MGANKLEAFTIETVNRKNIHGADYNPRKISETAKKKLKTFLKENGLWQPLTINRQTMTLVSGHQRLAIMDSLLRTDDYDLTMSVVDVDEKTEVSGNVFMNNPSAMGEWDITALQDIANMFPDIDYQNMGFDLSDIEVMQLEKEAEEIYNLVKDPVSEAKKSAKAETQGESPGDTLEESEPAFTADDFRDIKKKSRENAKAENDAGMGSVDTVDYVLQVVFPNNHEKRDFMRRIRKDPKEKYVKSTVLLDIFNHVYDLSVFGGQD